MAEKSKDKDKEKKGAADAPPPGKNKLLLPIIGVVVLGGGGGGYYFWTQQQAKHLEQAAETAGPKVALKFYSFEPPFVSNFEGAQAYRFLQVQMKIAVRSEETFALMTENEALFRNDVLMLLSQQNAEFLATKEGKDKLRAETLEIVRKIVTTLGGNAKAVENVLFTSFVMQ